MTQTPVFPRVTANDLRHTAASLAISAGANPKVVQRMLGHSSAAMTLDVYADLFDSDMDSVADNLSRLWGNTSPRSRSITEVIHQSEAKTRPRVARATNA